MNILRNTFALAASLSMALSLAAHAHETADNELAHGELPQLYYDFCISYEREIEEAKRIIAAAQDVIEMPNADHSDRIRAFMNLEHYGENLEESLHEIMALRKSLDAHGYSQGTCAELV